MPATISVIIPAYNVSNCIEKAILSALNQTLPPLEIIVVDDGSTDTTSDLVERMAEGESKIKLQRQGKNTGIAKASGEWIAILDADDYFLPERLRSLVTFAVDQNLLMVADNFYFHDPYAGRLTKIAIDPAIIGDRLDLDIYDFVSRCRGNRPATVDFGLLKPVIRRSFIIESQLKYDENLRHGEDFLFYFMALQSGARFVILPTPYYVYTERIGTVSRKTSHLSKTVNAHEAMLAGVQRLVEDTSDPRLAGLLLRRAEAIMRFPKMGAFQRRGTLGKLLSICDPDLREYVYEALRYKLDPRKWKKLPSQ
jgi:succinoglycan biosynthesis protein ExoO